MTTVPMLFDAHVHIGVVNNRWQDYIKVAKEKRVFKAVIFPFIKSSIEEIDSDNSYIIDSFIKCRELFIPFLLIPTNMSLLEKNEKIIKGLKQHFSVGIEDDSVFYPYYEFLQSRKLNLIIHPGSKMKVDSPEKLINLKIEKVRKILHNFPGINIILAHSGRNIPFMGKGVLEIVSEFKRYNNIFFETSTIRKIRIIEEMLKLVGSSRILFGTDYPFVLKNNYNDSLSKIYDQETEWILKSKISDTDKERIFKLNFEDLFLDEFWIRRVSKTDMNELLLLKDTLPSQDLKYLALLSKVKALQDNIKKEKNIYILESKKSKNIGYIRISDLPKKGGWIEEILVKPKFRGKGLGKFLIQSVMDKYSYIEAKTYSQNTVIIRLLSSLGFEVYKKSNKENILFWRKQIIP